MSDGEAVSRTDGAGKTERESLKDLLQRLILNQTKGHFIVQHSLDKLALCHSVWRDKREKGEIYMRLLK